MMLQEKEAQELMINFIDLRTKAEETKDPKDILKFKSHEAICIEKFKYLVSMKTSRYKAFGNYEDLNQEGLEALVKSMKNYNPKKGIFFFWWAHKYIDTRISRSANLHTTIRYPLKVAKETAPHKESVLPLLIEERYCPDKQVEEFQISTAIDNALKSLSDDQKNIIDLAFGFSGDKPLSINKICKKLSISRLSCIKLINSSLSALKENVKL